MRGHQDGPGSTDTGGGGEPTELVSAPVLIVPQDKLLRRVFLLTLVMLALSLLFGAFWLNNLGNRLDHQNDKLLAIARENTALSEQNKRLNESSAQALKVGTESLLIIKRALAAGPAQQKAFFAELSRRIQAAINQARFSIESQQRRNGFTVTIIRGCTGPPGRCR